MTLDRLRRYFQETKGTGVLGTADTDGNVNLALYASPHVMEDGTIAFIMADKISHANLLSNPRAAYLFLEKGAGYRGMRLSLGMIREEKNSELIPELRRRKMDAPQTGDRFLVVFTVEKVRPLTGAGEIRGVDGEDENS